MHRQSRLHPLCEVLMNQPIQLKARNHTEQDGLLPVCAWAATAPTSVCRSWTSNLTNLLISVSAHMLPVVTASASGTSGRPQGVCRSLSPSIGMCLRRRWRDASAAAATAPRKRNRRPGACRANKTATTQMEMWVNMQIAEAMSRGQKNKKRIKEISKAGSQACDAGTAHATTPITYYQWCVMYSIM